MHVLDSTLTEQQYTDMRAGLSALWVLVFKHRAGLERLLGLNREINGYLTMKTWDHWINFQSLVVRFESALDEAGHFLHELDDVIARNDSIQAELITYGEQITREMKSNTVKYMVDEFHKMASHTQKQVNERQAARVLARIKAEDALHHREYVTKAGYSENGDGTVTDVKTHLMWMQCAQGQVGPQCEGVVLQYTWDLAMRIPETLNKRGGFAGHTDWRLPSVQELQSLVRMDSHPTICLDAFPNAPEALFWTSTQLHAGINGGVQEQKDENTLIWNVYFGTGSLGTNAPYNSYAVRLVRTYE
ncbi:MAG: hypothetical protein RJB10_1638 [Pseudomonadota bacterium]|jgi:hypothetical protein